MNARWEKVSKAMRKDCETCGEQPEGRRLVFNAGHGLNQNIERAVFCSEKCAREWFEGIITED